MGSASRNRAEIEALSARWLAAERRQDVEAMLEMVTDDAVFLMPNGQSVTGKPAIAALFRSFFAAFSSDHHATIEEVEVFDTWAYVWWVETTVFTHRGGGPPVRLRGVGLSILRRDHDGRWRFARGINNLAPEPTTAVGPTS